MTRRYFISVMQSEICSLHFDPPSYEEWSGSHCLSSRDQIQISIGAFGRLHRPHINRITHVYPFCHDSQWFIPINVTWERYQVAKEALKSDLSLSRFDRVWWKGRRGGFNTASAFTRPRNPSKRVCSSNQFYGYINDMERLWPCWLQLNERRCGSWWNLHDIAHPGP